MQQLHREDDMKENLGRQAEDTLNNKVSTNYPEFPESPAQINVYHEVRPAQLSPMIAPRERENLIADAKLVDYPSEELDFHQMNQQSFQYLSQSTARDKK